MAAGYLSPLPIRRARVAGVHLLASLVIAVLVAAVIFFVWYPPPYASIAGGFALFGLLVGVDVVLGPMLTAIAASPRKPAKLLARDIAAIVVLQLAGLAYGLHTIALARPIYLSFEVDRLRVVTAADVEPASLAEAPPALRTLPWDGPKRIAAARPTKPDDVLRSIELGLAGIDISMEPRNWREFASYSGEAWRAARPLSDLLQKFPSEHSRAEQMAAAAGTSVTMLRFLPLVSRQASWSAVVAGPDARIVGYIPVDGFI